MDTRQTTTDFLPDALAVIVPAYNAGDKIRGVIDGLLKVARNVIVVDDGSTDGCVDAIHETAVTIITFAENRGKGHALLAGFAKALEDPEVECVAVLDADGQHDPVELPRLYREFVQQSPDLLIGAREFASNDVPFRSRFGNVLTIRALGVLLGARLSDTQSGYRILSRRFLQEVLPSMRGGRYETEMEFIGRAICGNYTIVSVPIRTIYVEGNATSHFRKVRDSFLIYRTLLKAAWGPSRKKRLPADNR